MYKQFVYIDSSEDQHPPSNEHQHPLNKAAHGGKAAKSRDSGKRRKNHPQLHPQKYKQHQYSQQQHRQQQHPQHPQQQQQQQQQQLKAQVQRQEQAMGLGHRRELSVDEEYTAVVTSILNGKIGEEQIKHFLTRIENTALSENIEKRNSNYRYFLQRMEIDNKYRSLMEEKVSRLALKNGQKKQVLVKQQNVRAMEEEARLLDKHTLTKMDKQQQVINGVRSLTRKLGMQAMHHTYKTVKQERSLLRKKREMQRQSQINRQRDQLQELQHEYEQIKDAKRINKIDQKRVLADMEAKIRDQKASLREKVSQRRNSQW